MDRHLNDLFLHTLKDVYFAEHAIIKALPKMAKAAHDSALKKAFEKHLDQTNGHIERLDRIFKLINTNPQSVPCEAIKGILKEGDEIVEEFSGSPALDGLDCFGAAHRTDI
jgi:ferritin-like metal-binding protein YciE